jgi:hypothetical protein
MKRLALAGFGIWLAATVALRAGGQWIFKPDQTIWIALLLGISAPAMFALPRGLFARFSIAPEGYGLGAIALVAPGMLLDTISAIWFPRVFPNIRPDAAGLFGGWLLFCNVLALISAASAAGRRPVAH